LSRSIEYCEHACSKRSVLHFSEMHSNQFLRALSRYVEFILNTARPIRDQSDLLTKYLSKPVGSATKASNALHLQNHRAATDRLLTTSLRAHSRISTADRLFHAPPPRLAHRHKASDPPLHQINALLPTPAFRWSPFSASNPLTISTNNSLAYPLQCPSD
jgi:hypothetical protein